MVRAILFDFNGVLVDDEPIHLQLFQQVLAEEGLAMSEEDYYAEYIGYDDRECFTKVLERAGRPVDGPRLMRLIARKASYYQERMSREGYPFFPGALELVRSLVEAGVPLGVVSGALRAEVDEALRQEGLEAAFKTVVTADDVERSKPDPESYRLAVERLNAEPPLPDRLIHPHEVLAIEDSPAGIASARGAGLATVAVAQTHDREELGAADRLVDRVGELSAEELLA